MLNFKRCKLNLYICALAALLALAHASIENKPVKVTHQNSGPSYDIDEVERTKLTPEIDDSRISRARAPSFLSPLPPPKINSREQEGDQQGENDGPLVGHINIRRIFLIPLSQPSQDDDTSSSASSSSSQNIWGPSRQPFEPERQAPPSEDDQTAPVWPFLSLVPTRHVFGADQASRSPTPAKSDEDLVSRPSSTSVISGERERENTPETSRQRPVFDPIQMMIEMMQQALSQAIMSPNGPFSDLNKESASQPDSGDNKADSSETTTNTGNTDQQFNEVPKRPNTELELPSPFNKQAVSKNSTKEEVVEIDGKKYLKKTVINRHVGENIIFMTKRLLFVPLNETSPTEATTEQNNKAETSSSPIPTEEIRKVEAASSPSSTTNTPTEASSTTTTGAPTTTVQSTTPSEAPSSTTTSTTTTTEIPSTTSSGDSGLSFKDKVDEAVEKASERLVKSVSSSS